MSNYIYHRFHLVDESPWPLLRASRAFFLTTGLVNWFWFKRSLLILNGLLLILLVIAQWWRDISGEGSFQGRHTGIVELGLRWGIALFIVSEIFFFLSFFWAFFHRSLRATVELGGVWPPMGIKTFNPWQVPLLNTLVLLSSGVTVTWRHHALMEGNHKEAVGGLVITASLWFPSIRSCWGFSHNNFFGYLFHLSSGFRVFWG